jgi:CSLREA domain-containing protein
MPTRKLCRSLLGVVAGSLIFAANASAANQIVVNSTADDNGTGCTLREAVVYANDDTTVGGCTNIPTNTVGDDDRILFDSTVFPAAAPVETINLGPGALNISSNVEIAASGHNNLVVNGDGSDTVMSITGGTVRFAGFSITGGGGHEAASPKRIVQGGGIFDAGGALTLSDVRLADNDATATAPGAGSAEADGGGIFVSADLTSSLAVENSIIENNTAQATQSAANVNTAFGQGGGIFNNGGPLSISNSTVDGNTAEADKTSTTVGTMGGAIAQAGGIYTETGPGVFTADRSAITNNTADGAVAIATETPQVRGGGIVNRSSNAKIELSTIAGNRTAAADPNPPTDFAAGVFDEAGSGQTKIVSSTIAYNGPSSAATTPAGKNLVSNGGGTVSLENTILADPFGGGDNCDLNSIISAGHNIDYSPDNDADGSCGFTTGGTDLFTDPNLGPLGLHEAPNDTATILPARTGSAVDQGVDNQTLSTGGIDQRGFDRPSDFTSITNASGGDGSDIGAAELQAITLQLNKSGSGSGSVTSSPGGINCGTACTSANTQFGEGEQVTLTATPASGSQPAMWNNCDSVNGMNQCLVTLSAFDPTPSVTAIFTAAPGSGGGGTTTTTPPAAPAASGPTGQRAAALKKCKKKKGKARKKCKKKAMKLPV